MGKVGEMKYTISTHTGSSLSREHNIRKENYVRGQKHINPEGKHEIWYDETERHAYRRLFNTSQMRYNARQTHSNKKINDYYQSVKKSGRGQNTAYEMIITVGNKDNMPDLAIGETIMHAFVDGWAERNPNMEMIGAYYHADEQGAPHVHIDFVPIAHNFKRGMDTQTSYNKALAEMGYTGRLAGAEWWAHENQTLEDICNAQGLEIEHPKEGLSHLDTELYKFTEDLVTKTKNEIGETKIEVLEQMSEKKKWNKTIPAITKIKTDDFNRLSNIDFKLEQASNIAFRLEHQANTTAIVLNAKAAQKTAEKQYYSTARDNYELTKQLKVLKDQLRTTEDDLQSVRNDYKSLQDKVNSFQSENNRLKDENKSLKDEITKLRPPEKTQKQIHKPPTHRR